MRSAILDRVEASLSSTPINHRNVERQLRAAERQLCVEALTRTQGIDEAAELLGITRAAFLARLIRHGITMAECTAPMTPAARGARHTEPRARPRPALVGSRARARLR